MKPSLASPFTTWYRRLYVQVLAGMALGIATGLLFPRFGSTLKPLGDTFIALVRMMIAPIIFCTLVHGMASMGDLRKLGRMGLKTAFYFESVSNIALLLGLVTVNLIKPGAGFHGHAEPIAQTASPPFHPASLLGMLRESIPDTLVGAFISPNLLQILVVSLIAALAIPHLPDGGRHILSGIGRVSGLLFAMLGLIVRFAPFGVFGAMAFMAASHGTDALLGLLRLIVCFYGTAILFVVLVLGGILRLCGAGLWAFLGHLREELLLVLGTSSSETAMPGVMEKLERLGCRESTVGLVIPTGYSFNLDGTNIYMTMAVVFLAQATGTPMDLSQQLGLLLVAMITSQGATGVAGSGFIVLAATLEAIPTIPIASLGLLVGIDHFMSVGRAVTNFIGNAVATIAISRWEGELDRETLRERLRAGEAW
jgi:aerobic C4-dicarboxylate transport protein